MTKIDRLIKSLEFMQSMANVDDDNDTFFCKEANFPNLIASIIDIANEIKTDNKLQKESKTIELVLKGFDGSTDKTDNKIIWLRVPIDSKLHLSERSNAIESMSEIKQKFTTGIDLTIN